MILLNKKINTNHQKEEARLKVIKFYNKTEGFQQYHNPMINKIHICKFKKKTE
jgi:hypothetical protein